MKTIVALVDLSEEAFKVLKQAHRMAAAFGSRVVLVHVVPQQPVVMDLGIASPTVLETPSPEAVAQDRAKLQEMQESLSKFGISVECRQLTDGTADAVMDEVRNLAADLVIMGSHRHGTLYNLFVGSVTHDVLKRMTCPVMLVPVGEE
jgi:nucleotide-binding universal stress UspA family protein